ncbi:hypothetical protein EDC01DRAFT_443832 [Geopyxis carbonaria]|nr:hypothetical protein EDC01DRAFT_443832 [Geopyxis carbonaria]
MSIFSRRESTDSTTSSRSEFVSENFEDSQFPPSRLSHEQTVILERHFSDTPKPSIKTRRVLSEATGLSVQRVAAWFQSRRAKAKQQKKHEELHTKRILESAGRRRATVPSSPAIEITHSVFNYMQDSIELVPTPPRRTQSAAALVPVLCKAPGHQDQSIYNCPSEASYASLARSLAVAKAAAGSHEGTISPWPVSAFSDYGSSQCSYANTPYSSRLSGNPFEYGNQALSIQTSRANSYHPNETSQDSFAAFAEAVEMNSMSYNFVLPTLPIKSLVERRSQHFGIQSQPQLVSEEPISAVSNRKQPLNLSASSTVEDHFDSDSTLANRLDRLNTESIGLQSQPHICSSQCLAQAIPNTSLPRVHSVSEQSSDMKSPGPPHN